ncbi:MAG: peptidylprolyl isomerase [Candidatus Handelsmanbacteria bacterium]|nr:peptidylprolyl isomerase [Candidatus Handelsmanbacteria bacterium]
MNEKAPASFKAEFSTSAGDFIIEVTRDLSPNGADRFYNLVNNGFFDGQRFFRVVPGFVVQFGLHGDSQISAAWREAKIPDDPVQATNARGTISFATAGPNTRTTQLFINYRDNGRLDGMGFSPFGKVVEGMELVDKINSEYGEKPSQGKIQAEGNAYLEEKFPKLDYIESARIK